MQMMIQHSYLQPVAPQQIYRTISESHALNQHQQQNHQNHHSSTVHLANSATGSSDLATSSNGDTSSVKFGRVLSKKASRVKEIMLQNIGRVDRSGDSVFKMHEQNFYKQHSQASKLYKAFRSHHKSLKISQESGRQLNSCIEEISADYQVARHDLICDGITNMESLNEAHLDKLRQRILLDLSQFNNNFVYLKEKIAKRRRKQIDHDASKRLYELARAQLNKKRANATEINSETDTSNPKLSVTGKVKSMFKLKSTGGASLNSGDNSTHDSLESTASRLVEEARLLKLREQYNYCKIMFETVNGELCDELPMLYDCKMKQTLSVIHSYFSLGAKFHSECSKLMASSGHAIEEFPFAMIAREASQGSLPVEQQQQQSDPNGSLFGHQEMVDDDDDQEEEGDERIEGEETDQDEEDAMKDDELSSKDPSGVKAVAVVTSSGSSSGNSSRGDSASVSGQGSPDHHEVVVQLTTTTTHHDMDDDHAMREDIDHDIKLEVCSISSSFDGDDLNPPGIKVDLEKQQPVRFSTSSSLVVSLEPNRSNQEHAESLVNPCQSFKCGSFGAKIQAMNCEKNPSIKNQAIPSQCPPKSSFSQAENHLDDEISSTRDNRCLYKVKTQFKYLAEDVDELCFEADEIIQVVEFEPSQEPEDGWLMGVREVNGQKGLFPANFTKPI